MREWIFFDWGGTLVADTPEGVHERPLRLMPHARSVLEELSCDFSYGIVTNTRTARKADVQTALVEVGLASRFPVVVTSLDVGVRKPDRRIFERALQEADCPPERALFVGNDALADVAGAKDAGLFAVYLDTEGRGAALAPDVTIGTLGDLPSAVDRWRTRKN